MASMAIWPHCWDAPSTIPEALIPPMMALETIEAMVPDMKPRLGRYREMSSETRVVMICRTMRLTTAVLQPAVALTCAMLTRVVGRRVAASSAVTVAPVAVPEMALD